MAATMRHEIEVDVTFTISVELDEGFDESKQEAAYDDHDEDARVAYSTAARLAGEAGTLLLTTASRLEK